MLRLDLLGGVRNAACLVFCSTLVFSGALSSLAESVSLVWEPSPDTSVVGYNVYYGTASRDYTQMICAGNATTIQISNLTAGLTYYFAATAYDSWGLESEYSEETSYSIPWPVLNYEPTLDSIATQTIQENSGTRTVSLTGISSGSPNEAQELTITALSSNPGLIPTPSVSYTSPNTTGSLTFTPVAFASGSATIAVTINDHGVTNSTITRSFQVNVISVNQSPTLANLNDLTLAEDAGSQTINLGGISSGAANESQTLVVTASSSNTGLIPAPTVTYASPSEIGSIRLTPVANNNGTSIITVSVNDGGASNNIVLRTFTVTVNSVNDAPTLNAVENLALNQNAAAQTVNLTGITSGATNEVQTLTVTASSSDPSLIPHPTVNYASPANTGILTLAPSAGVGSAVITVRVSDGQAVNSTSSRTFTVVINEPPTISDIPNKVVALGSNSPPVAFTIGDSETLPENLLVTAVSSNSVLVPNGNIVLGGSGASRTITITPVAGNIGVAMIVVSVSDGKAVVSDTFQFAVQPRPAPPGGLQLVVEGRGQIIPSLAEPIVVGKTYTVTAVPAPEYVFAGWSGAVSSTSPKVSFVAAQSTYLKAKFVLDPYSPTTGLYSGLFYESDEVRQGSGGFFSLQSNSRGKYSGYVQIGLKRFPFSGRLDLECQATNVIKRSGKSSLVVRFAIGSGEQTDAISGEVTDSTWVAQITAKRATFHSRTNPAPWLGQYTMVLPGQDTDPLLPLGHSYGTLKVTASGTAVFKGKLADGQALTRSTRIFEDGSMPLYAPLYAGAGSLMSWLGMEDRTGDDFHGTVQWLKPEMARAALFPSGFAYATELVGSVYNKPTAASGPVLNLADGFATFSSGDEEFSNGLQISANNRFTNLGSNKMSVAFASATGLYQGSVTDPESGTVLKLGGCVFQKQNAGYGFYRSTQMTGRVTLH